MLRTPLLAFALLLLLGASSSPHQDPDDNKAKAHPKIEEFAWLAGEWRGEGLGGTCEAMV